MAMLCHLLAFAGVIAPFPGASIVGPLILWSIKKDSMPFVNEQGKEAINFNITLSIIIAICALLFWLIFPIVLAIIIGLAGVVCVIIAAIRTSEGKHYRYPWCIRFVK